MSEHEKPIKLSYTAQCLLLLVDHMTDRDWETGEIKAFLYPHKGPYFSIPGVACGDYGFTLGGSGQAAAFKGLERKGLIERPPGCNIPLDYCYAITEKGRVQCELILHPPGGGEGGAR